jgi:hypothetical protein
LQAEKREGCDLMEQGSSDLDATKPDWLVNHVPARNPGNPNWKRGVSGNPKGRPPGKTPTQRVQSALNEGSVEVAKKVLEAAQAGDMQAAGLVLARVSPTLRAQSEKVEFDLDTSLPLSAQLAQVAEAVACGQVSLDAGQQISAMLSNLATVRSAENLEERIIALEAKVVS